MDEFLNQYADLLDMESRLEQKKKDADAGLKDTRASLEALKIKIVSEMQESGCLQASARGLFFETKSVPPNPVVTDEALLPEKYFRVKREVDKAKINADIKDGVEISGVSMGNGGVTLAVRGKR